MHVAERAVEDHRIYAAAIAAEACSPSARGFHAAVVVVRQTPGSLASKEVFRDECLEDGKIWTEPGLALQFALEVGEAAIGAQAWLAEQELVPRVSSSESSSRAA